MKPRRTFESTISELIEGLESGTVVLERPPSQHSLRRNLTHVRLVDRAYPEMACCQASPRAPASGAKK